MAEYTSTDRSFIGRRNCGIVLIVELGKPATAVVNNYGYRKVADYSSRAGKFRRPENGPFTAHFEVKEGITFIIV